MPLPSLFTTVFASMQFVCSPLLGVLSDRFGRRPAIVLSNLGLGLDFVLMALAPTLGWLFAGRVIGGIRTTAKAYIADVVLPEKRAASFGLLGAAFGLGFILGTAIGGLLGSGDTCSTRRSPEMFTRDGPLSRPSVRRVTVTLRVTGTRGDPSGRR